MQQQTGAIRGIVFDKDFDAPLPGAQVVILELDQKTQTTDQGNYVFNQVPPGKYTVVYWKEGFVRQMKSDVMVSSGQLTDVNIYLEGDFTEMDEFIVQDILQFGFATEAALLKLRFDSPSLMDSISMELMGRAGASDAASALKLVAGASVKDDKSAVIRGMPDRYVSSQINGVRLPSADEDKRAVELDQFPVALIESVQVSKTFTPDQQGDASGGAVNVLLRSIPEEWQFSVKSQIGANSQAYGEGDFLSYHGGGVDFWGKDSRRKVQPANTGGNWNGAVGVSTEDAPLDYKWSWAAGGKHEFDTGVTVGGFVSFFYERDSSFFDDGVDDAYWVDNIGEPMTPEKKQQTASNEFITTLFDVTQGKQSVQWGGLATLGMEMENLAFNLIYMQTRTAEDTATLAVNTRGKHFYFPGYDPNDPYGIGNDPDSLDMSPYLRLETLDYKERIAETIQLNGRHTIPMKDLELGGLFTLTMPKVDWTLARSSADLNQPDKRQFGGLWHPASFNPGTPPWVPPFISPETWWGFKPSANFTLGNFQRIWKEINEDSLQYFLDLKLPFEQWDENEGYFKFGVFHDQVDRKFDQNTFSNFNDNSSYEAGFDQPWTDVFTNENHPITDGPPFVDVDYDGELEVFAWYGMMDLPVFSNFNLIGGARVEHTDLSITNYPEINATWVPKGNTAPESLEPGEADVAFSQEDLLPSIGFVYTPFEPVTFRGAYSQTVARQTFKEITPILQQEFLGGPIFIGNPELRMSELKNYDLRLDYTPYEGSLVSVSWFSKDIKNPIEYVQQIASFSYTTAENYPEGVLKGFELEARQKLGHFYDPLEGLAVGANATFIDSEVTLPQDEIEDFIILKAPMKTREMTNAPEYLYNLYMTYDIDHTGTKAGIFYTLQGDTLTAGAGESGGNFVPSVYAKKHGTLNMSVSQKLGRYFKLKLQAKNLLNPSIKEVYRSDYVLGDVTKTSYRKGIDYSLSLSFEVKF